jgi:hypothetical protein
MAIGSALAAGVGLDLLAWGRPVGPGLSAALALAVIALWVTVRRQQRLDVQSTALLAAALALALVPSIRASIVLVTLAVLAWTVVIAVAVASIRTGGIQSWTFGTYLRSALGWPLALAEPVLMASAELQGHRASTVSWARKSLPAVRALAVSWMVLTFFTLLLSAADPIFGGIVSETLDVDLSLDRIIRFSVVAGGVAWLVLGLSRRALTTSNRPATFRPGSFGVTEALAVIGSLNLLFAGFLAVQFAYLFDGEVGRVELGYAQYARQGFFELVFAAACVLSLILVTDWFVHRRVKSLDLLYLALIAQTLVMTWSAVVRMMAYTDEFGLSELRLYTTAFMGWIAVMMGLAAVTVLRSRRDSFALGAFIAGIVAIAALVAVSPDAMIAETNLARGDSPHGIDVAYLSGLSPDAVPAMVAALDTVDPGTRDALTTALRSSRDDLAARAATWGWRSWSLAHHRASEATAD